MTAAASSEKSPVINVMTVDVEDYFHVSAFDGIVPRTRWATLESRVERNTDRLLAIFDETGVTATFFVLGWVAERFPQLVRRIAQQRHEVASHGYAHRLVYDMTPGMFREDIERSKDLLEAAAGRAVEGYRAPSYSITPRSLWALDVLIEPASSTTRAFFPLSDRYGIPLSPRVHSYCLNPACGSIIEAPASTVRWGCPEFSGSRGGYFRILPYQWTRWGIARINRDEHATGDLYMHPGKSTRISRG